MEIETKPVALESCGGRQTPQDAVPVLEPPPTQLEKGTSATRIPRVDENVQIPTQIGGGRPIEAGLNFGPLQYKGSDANVS
jgi:hypothetical protein